MLDPNFFDVHVAPRLSID